MSDRTAADSEQKDEDLFVCPTFRFVLKILLYQYYYYYFSFLLLFSFLNYVKMWITNFMKQPASISELSPHEAYRPKASFNLMLVFLNLNQIENRE